MIPRLTRETISPTRMNENEWCILHLKKDRLHTVEGLPGVLGNKGTLAKYRREQRNISQFLGTREQNSKNYSTKMCGKYENVWEMCVRKCVGTWEHRAILEGNKGTRTPPGRPSLMTFFFLLLLAWAGAACVSPRARARGQTSHVSKYSPGSHVYRELITKNFHHLSFQY